MDRVVIKLRDGEKLVVYMSEDDFAHFIDELHKPLNGYVCMDGLAICKDEILYAKIG